MYPQEHYNVRIQVDTHLPTASQATFSRKGLESQPKCMNVTFWSLVDSHDLPTSVDKIGTSLFESTLVVVLVAAEVCVGRTIPAAAIMNFHGWARRAASGDERCVDPRFSICPARLHQPLDPRRTISIHRSANSTSEMLLVPGQRMHK